MQKPLALFSIIKKLSQTYLAFSIHQPAVEAVHVEHK